LNPGVFAPAILRKNINMMYNKMITKISTNTNTLTIIEDDHKRQTENTTEFVISCIEMTDTALLWMYIREITLGKQKGGKNNLVEYQWSKKKEKYRDKRQKVKIQRQKTKKKDEDKIQK